MKVTFARRRERGLIAYPPPQVRMGITGVVWDKDTELGIADAVIAVEGINHDVTTGVRGRGRPQRWGGAFRRGRKQRITGS